MLQSEYDDDDVNTYFYESVGLDDEELAAAGLLKGHDASHLHAASRSQAQRNNASDLSQQLDAEEPASPSALLSGGLYEYEEVPEFAPDDELEDSDVFNFATVAQILQQHNNGGSGSNNTSNAQLAGQSQQKFKAGETKFPSLTGSGSGKHAAGGNMFAGVNSHGAAVAGGSATLSSRSVVGADDFIRSFLSKFKMYRTLDSFHSELQDLNAKLGRAPTQDDFMPGQQQHSCDFFAECRAYCFSLLQY